MSRQAQQSKEWNFTVAPTRMHLPNGKPTPVFANVRTDTEEVVGIVSENRYGLIQNGDFVQTVRSALDNLGMTDYREEIITTNASRRLYATYHFNNRIKTVHSVGDKVGLSLNFQNSFDGTLAAAARLFALQLKCLNGMVMTQGLMSLYQRHNPNINLEFVQTIIASAVKEFDKGLQVFNQLGQIPCSDEQGLNIFKHIPFSKKTREIVSNTWISPVFSASRGRNLYWLYDAVTQHCKEIEDSRYEQAQRTNRMAIHKITSAIDPLVFAELSKPPVEVATEVVVVEA